MKNKELTYAEAIAEVEQILARMNGESPDIDTLAADVKRATELLTMCRERLRKTEEEVQKILGDKE